MLCAALVAVAALVSDNVGIKRLSKNVIKQVWREGRLQDLHDTRLAVDTAGWIVKAVTSNAQDICLEKADSTKHHADFTRRLQNVLHLLPDSSSLILVLDGDRWPLKKAQQPFRCSREGWCEGWCE
uniref:XPG N-terminal domain-containing protein n=1 Tax=Haptolina ericina TaxID=156174 RepID=A0A7S3AE47_9EUKA|mmetsp:Transcript_1033/g.2198  ORF Transcript_1033/g.2198 Transcript_1033/m.2198 type:complete len:126 (+) Transcript_1033:59-436(+)